MANFAAAARAMKPVDGTALEGERRGGARRLSRQHQARAAARRGEHGRGHRLAEQAPARRRHRHQRRRQLRGLPASLLPVSRLQDPARADQRRDGLRRAGGGGGQDRRAQPHGRVARGRRLLPDERPGVRDRRPARRQHRDRRSSTTACTARSACTRSASIRRACYGTELKNPDFAAYARAFGGHGETVEKTEDFAAAFERALAAGKPAIIHVKTDPEALTSRITLEQAARAVAGEGALGSRWARRMSTCAGPLRLYRDARGDLSRPACDHVKNR